MNEIDFSQLEKLQKQMESVDYTKACASAMNVISQKALKYISNVTKPGHYKNGKTGGTLKKSWQTEETTVSGSTVKGGIYTALEYAPYVEFGHRTRLGKGTSPKYKPKKNGKAWVEGKKYLNTVVPKVERDAPKILMQKMEEVLK